MANKKKFKPTEEELQEWNEIEELVIQYQTYVDIDNTKYKHAVCQLQNRFPPLFKKYIF